MKKNLEARIEELEENLPDPDAGYRIILEDGGSWKMDEEPWGYILEHGRFAPDGRKIVDLERPEDWSEWDALSKAIYEADAQACRGEWNPRETLENLDER